MLTQMWRNSEPSYTVGGHVKWCNCYRKQFDIFFKKLNTEVHHCIMILISAIHYFFFPLQKACAITEEVLFLEPEVRFDSQSLQLLTKSRALILSELLLFYLQNRVSDSVHNCQDQRR